MCCVIDFQIGFGNQFFEGTPLGTPSGIPSGIPLGISSGIPSV